MPDFRSFLADDRILFFDGGYGTFLQQRGLPAGLSPELWGLERPDVIRGVHEEYVRAGADALTTNTFGGSRYKLGGKVDVAELNARMAAIAREVAGDNVFVGGSVGPTGHFVEPLGELTFRELVEAYREQIRGLVRGGVDFILGETHFDLAEAKALVVAAREVCDLPVAVSMTFEQGRCLTGSTPQTFVDTMQNLGVELIGTNCSAGPEQMLAVVEAMGERLSTPLFVEANAGLPELDADGNTVFRLQPLDFAAHSTKFLEHGAKLVGGCCGTGPDHIRALREACSGRTWKRPVPRDDARIVLTSRALSVPVGFDHPLAVIGERINPTGKKDLTAQLQEGRFDEALRFAAEQTELGAPLLDVNVGAPLVDEKVLLPELVKTLVARFQAPLSIDSTDPDAIEAALWHYPGSPLVNSISGEPGRMERLGPLCKKFGAPFILLPIVGRKLPFTFEERKAVVEQLLRQADELGIPRRLIMVDALALTVSSKPEAAKHCLRLIRHCTEELGLATTLGLSNISFGLPARELLNGSFLTLCMGAGLTTCIANPNSASLQQALASAEVLLCRDPQAARFIAGYSGWEPGSGGAAAAGGQTGGGKAENLHDAVVKGAKDSVLAMVEERLADGDDPFALVNEDLIPAIMEVGEKYERREYFLPQLLLSAETMQIAFGRLKPLLEDAEGAAAKDVIIMATVEGDIHDIGKNIVCLMLRNQGFEVVDLGKDVPAERIVAAAEEHGAKIIGLSALMTTTMVRMEDTIKLVADKGLDVKIMIGGAVITEAFCSAIGADGFATDAVTAVKLAQRFVQ